jgi:hypothetical protein
VAHQAGRQGWQQKIVVIKDERVQTAIMMWRMQRQRRRWGLGHGAAAPGRPCTRKMYMYSSENVLLDHLRQVQFAVTVRAWGLQTIGLLVEQGKRGQGIIDPYCIQFCCEAQSCEMMFSRASTCLTISSILPWHEPQRKRPSAHWKIWKEGRGFAEAHQHFGKL